MIAVALNIAYQKCLFSQNLEKSRLVVAYFLFMYHSGIIHKAYVTTELSVLVQNGT